MKLIFKILLIALLPVLLLNSCKKDPLLLTSDFTTYLDEHPATGKVIGNVTAGSSEGSLTFSVVSSTPVGALAIDPSTGILSVADASLFDYETNQEIEGQVKIVCDGVSKKIDVLIYLNDIELVAGNNSTIGFAESSSMGANYLLGRKYTLTGPGTVMSLGLVGRSTGANVMMALYEDNNGVPGNLLAKTSSGIINSWGILSLPVTTPVELEEGDYWVMAVYNTTGYHVYRSDNASAGTIYYASLTYGSAPPANAAGFISYSGHDFTYFMVVD